MVRTVSSNVPIFQTNRLKATMELITKEILIYYTYFLKTVRVFHSFGVLKVILASDQIFQSQPRQPFQFHIWPRLDRERRTRPDEINFIAGDFFLTKL